MAAESPPPADRDGDDVGDEEVTITDGRAEAVLLRTLEVRAEFEGVLGDLEADVRRDPAVLDPDRLDRFDDAIGEAMQFSNQLRDVVDDAQEGDDAE